jgi:hypothetical protein
MLITVKQRNMIPHFSNLISIQTKTRNTARYQIATFVPDKDSDEVYESSEDNLESMSKLTLDL